MIIFHPYSMEKAEMLHANHEKYSYLCKKLHSLCQEQKHLHRKRTFQALGGVKKEIVILSDSGTLFALGMLKQCSK